MFRGKVITLFLFTILFSCYAFAQEELEPVESAPNQETPAEVAPEAETPAKVVKKVRVIKARKIKPKWLKSFSVGGSYMLWNEDLNISQSGARSKGFANYGGYGFSLDYSWLGRRWMYGTALGFAFGKASSGGFSTPTFEDGLNRAWWALQASGALYYRWNSTFMWGSGLVWRERTVDWKPFDDTLSVDADRKTKIAPQMILRWRVNDTFTFMQTYTLLDFKNSTMWTWTAQIDI